MFSGFFTIDLTKCMVNGAKPVSSLRGILNDPRLSRYAYQIATSDSLKFRFASSIVLPPIPLRTSSQKNSSSSLSSTFPLR